MNMAHIILVEDDDTQAVLTQHSLAKLDPDIEVTRFHDGNEFLNFIRRRPLPDVQLALLDLHMPGAGGIEVLRELHDSDIRPPFPIVVFSSSQDPDEVSQVYELGGTAFVTKPLGSADYHQALHNIVNFWISTNRLA